MDVIKNTYDVIVVGAGSGGIGAALAASRLGAKVLLVEKNEFVGGNAAHSGVSIWEMGVGGTGVPFDIYKELKEVKDAVGIYSFHRHCAWKNKNGISSFPPGADIIIDSGLTYLDSLRRFGARSISNNEAFVRRYWHGVVFEPLIYAQVVTKMLKETGNCDLILNTSVEQVIKRDEEIKSLILSDGQVVTASYFIDATDNGNICQMFGSEMMFGREPKSEFNEPDAPNVSDNKVNGVTLIYRVEKANKPSIGPLPPAIPEECWWQKEFPLASMVQYPNSDYNVNILPAMDGEEYLALSKNEAFSECKNRALAL